MTNFLFITCQIGAEPAVKAEMGWRYPGFRFSYSRPGFLTFKMSEDLEPGDDFQLRCVFARSHGYSLGGVRGEHPEELARQAWELVVGLRCSRIHVWPRDTERTGRRGFEPVLTDACLEFKALLRRTCPRPEDLSPDDADPLSAARDGATVLDCVVIRPGEWWIGWHQAREFASRWPGGMVPLTLPDDAVSRAWLKMEEALRWSSLPIPPGAHVAEIGSALGGASQALLDRGFQVTGVDSAKMAEAVLEHPRFTHLRRRASQVDRREFRKVHWLTADMNVAPGYTLDVIEDIVTHPEVRIRGLLLTMKLLEWKLTERLPEYFDRIRGWGFQQVFARQLQHNHQEFCVAALRSNEPRDRGGHSKRGNK